MSIFKACDIRGIYNKDLLNSHAEKLGQVLSHLQGGTDVIVGGDARVSTFTLKQNLIKGLLDGGCKVVDLGLVSTPMFYFARHILGIKTGVMVTASHNPPDYNGFKLILGDLPITEAEIETIRVLMDRDTNIAQKTGKLENKNILQSYLDFGVNYIENLSDLSVVVDYGNGLGALAGPALWNNSQCRYLTMYETIDGSFPDRSPNPSIAKNIESLRKAVINHRADMGIAYDGDADRVSFIDNTGIVISNDVIIALFVKHVLQSGPGTIVFDQKCSRIVPEIILSSGGNPVMEKSGHTFIKTTFIKTQAEYAGELSGHHFFRSFPQGDDGLFASLLMAGYIAKSGLNFSDLINAIPRYPITPDIRISANSEQAEKIIKNLAEAFKDHAQLNFMDGIKVDLHNGWGLARSSVTEPLITLRFEGDDEAALKDIIHRFAQAVPEISKKLLSYIDRKGD